MPDFLIRSGIRRMQKIAKGQWKPLKTEYEIEPKEGYDLHTTIDLKIQDFTHNELLSQLEKFDKQNLYVKKWIPELNSGKYAKPIIDHKFARERALRIYKEGLSTT